MNVSGQPSRSTTELSDTKPVFANPPLTKGSKIAIGVVVSVIIVGVALGIVFGVVLKKHNKGFELFGSLNVVDDTTNTTTKISPGDSLQLSYTNHHTGLSNWYVSTNHGDDFTVIDSNIQGNTVKYTVPETTCTLGLVFKVEDTVNTKDYVLSKQFICQPRLQMTKGPGTTAGAIVYIDTSVQTVLSFDSTLVSNVSAVSNWSVQISDDINFVQNLEKCTVTNYNVTTQTLTWTFAGNSVNNVYIKVSTVTTTNKDCTNGLSVISPHTFNVASKTCNEAGICQVIMYNSQGYEPVQFYPSEPIVLEFTSGFTLSGNALWQYSTDGGTTKTTFSGVVGQVNNTSLNGSLFTSTFTVYVTANGYNKTSPVYIVKPIITLGNEAAEISLTTPALPILTHFTSTVTIEPSSTVFTSWSIGTSLSKTTEPSIYYSQVAASGTTLTWYMNADQVGLILVGQSKSLYLWFKATLSAGSLTTSSASLITFTYGQWSPTRAPIYGPIATTGANNSWKYIAQDTDIDTVSYVPSTADLWFPALVSGSINTYNVCYYNPSWNTTPPTVASLIECFLEYGSFIATYQVGSANIIEFNRTTNTTYPICLSITNGNLLAADNGVHWQTGIPCPGTATNGLQVQWTAFPGFT